MNQSLIEHKMKYLFKICIALLIISCTNSKNGIKHDIVITEIEPEHSSKGTCIYHGIYLYDNSDAKFREMCNKFQIGDTIR